MSLGQFNDALQTEEDAPRDEDAIGAFPRFPPEEPVRAWGLTVSTAKRGAWIRGNDDATATNNT